MRKLFTLSMIAAVVIIMSDCSPKVAKKTASSEDKTAVKKEQASTSTAIKNPSTDDVVQQAQGNRSNQQQVELLTQATTTRVETGGQLYATNCSKCHDLYKPGSRRADSWVEIMKTMGPKAKLETGTYMMISSYLVKNAKG